MTVSKKYLVVLTDENAPEKHVIARDEKGGLLFELNIRQSEKGAPFYLDVERFIGKNVFFYCGKDEFFFDGETELCPAPSKENESLRPVLHYTVPYGWLNDPNGLIFYDGRYHIFCQHNPLGTSWGNMHWNHSVTNDFIHFKHLGDALFPDATGTIFSGSAICDKENVSGLGKNALLLFYTAAEYSHGFHKPRFSQCLAYSTDGVHFTKYGSNPVVPNIKGENRDPKVVFVPEMNAYVMALYLDGDEYCLLRSENLLDWTRFQTIHLSGEGECPDLYYLKQSGKWIFSGAADYYLVGHFDKNGFVAEQGACRYFRELDGRLSYAAQSYSGLEGRVLRISWENINPENAQCFCGQLSVPLEMSLVTLNNGKMKLKGSVCSEIETKLKPICEGKDKSYTVQSTSFVADIRFKNEDFSLSVDDTVFNISVSNNTVSYKDGKIPLTLSGKHNIRLIADKMSIEILADDGLIFSCVRAVSLSNTRTLSLSEEGIEVTVLKYE